MRPAKRLKSMGEADSCKTEWHLYPCASKILLNGDQVYFRPKSAGGGKYGTIERVIAGNEQRAIVRFDNAPDKEISVSLKRVVPVYKRSREGATIIVTRETFPYRHLAASQVKSSDVVLEIGCSTGEASVALLQTTQSWMGWDVSSDMVARCKRTVQSSDSVFKMDLLTDPNGANELLQENFSTTPTVVFIDIGGNRDAASALRVLQWSLRTCSPQLCIVKNQALVNECTDSSQSSCRVMNTGGIQGANSWFQQQMAAILLERKNPAIPEHPLQAPMVVSPTDESTPICRYHNYHREGCKRGNDCPFDHGHCHLCRQPGHVARSCKEVRE